MSYPELLEAACRAHHARGLAPGQATWDRLLAKNDDRILLWREQMRAAFEAEDLVALDECPGAACHSQIRELSHHCWHCPACDGHLTSGLLCPYCGTRYHIKLILTEPEQAT